MSVSKAELGSSGNLGYRLAYELRERHASWYFWTIVYTGLAVVCLAASLVDERLFQGVSVWHKPFKFALSLAVYFATIGWFASLMPASYFNTTRGKVLSTIPIVCGLLEMLYILIQGARGEASHFNYSTPLTSILYSLMGLGAVLLVAVCLWMGASILRHRGTSDIWVLSVAIGLIGTFVLGGGFGGYLGGANAHWVGGETTDAGGLPLVNWSRSGGDLRVAHFFGIHAMQIIPLFGAALLWLQNSNKLGPSQARLTLVCASIVFAAFCTATFVQAINGSPFLLK